MTGAKLIDANPIMKALLKKKSGVADGRFTDGYNDALMRFRSMLHSAPSVDAVSVVRCGECIQRNTVNCPMWKDEVRYPIKDDGFCCYGERKNGVGTATNLAPQ